MKQFIKFTGYVLVFLMLGAPFSIHANSLLAASHLPFVLTFGTWNVPGDTQTEVADEAIIPFSVDEISNHITNEDGDITFSRGGVYQVTLGVIVDAGSGGARFNIELAGEVVSGGKIFPAPGFVFNTITVMFSAAAGDHLVVRNVSGAAVLIGSPDPGQVASYISILKI